MYKFLVCFFFFSLFSTSQNKIVDSLKKAILLSKEDTSKVNSQINLCRELLSITDFKQADSVCDKALKLATNLSFKKAIGRINNIKGLINDYHGNYPEAIKYYSASLKICTEIGLKKGAASSLNNIGQIYWNLGNFPEALSYYFKCLKIGEEIPDKGLIIASNGNIGLIYLEQKKYDEALKKHFFALEIAKEVKEERYISNCYFNIGNAYFLKKKYSEALEYHLKALDIRLKNNDVLGLTESYKSIGSIYDSEGNIPEAVKYYLKTVEMARSSELNESLATSLINLAKLYAAQKKSDVAQKFINEAITLSKKINNKFLIKECYLGLSYTARLNKNYKLAYESYVMYSRCQDSILNSTAEKKTIQNAMQYEFEKKEIGIKAEQEKKDIAAEKDKQKQRTIIYSVLVGLLITIIFAFVTLRAYRLKQKANVIITVQKETVEQQKHIIEEKHKEITDSINYAERIQRSFLATKQLLDENLKEHFVFFQPKDVVSGDFYWAAKLSNDVFALATADSTGHGVPGAIMSILNISSLERSIEQGLTEPAAIFDHTRLNIISRLKKDGSAEGGKDGMDCSLVCFDFKNNQFTYAAANNPVWVVRNDLILEFAPDKMPVGKHERDSVPFTQHTVDLQKNDVVYTLTDGMPDQFGGPKGKKFMYKKLKELLISISSLPMKEQKEALKSSLEAWKGDLEQVDDICLIGIRI